ncbi:MAG: class IV adenylate cyclase [Acidobacteriota bacterium]|nr:class IV adenylate cyclase [Acidobacteriota bacterium]
MNNVEIKARVRDLDAFAARLKALRPSKPRVLVQEDVFFKIPKGRLKLRILGPRTGELIYYERPDAAGPKLSSFEIARTSDPAGLRAVLAAAFGVRGVVRKIRLAARAGQTRIHLDAVSGLGLFAELEVVLRRGQAAADGAAVARALMKKLKIRPADLVSGAYLDLLEKASGSAVSPSAKTACDRKPSGNTPSA